MAKTVTTRQCIGCGEKKDKKELIRIVRNAAGEYSIDATGRKNGRGAYICNNAKCLENACRKNGLDRSFKENVPEEIYIRLKGEFEKLG